MKTTKPWITNYVKELLLQKKTYKEIKEIIREKYYRGVGDRTIAKIKREIKQDSLESLCNKIDFLFKQKKDVTLSDWIGVRKQYDVKSDYYVYDFKPTVFEVRRDKRSDGTTVRLLSCNDELTMEWIHEYKLSTMIHIKREIYTKFAELVEDEEFDAVQNYSLEE